MTELAQPVWVSSRAKAGNKEPSGRAEIAAVQRALQEAGGARQAGQAKEAQVVGSPRHGWVLGREALPGRVVSTTDNVIHHPPRHFFGAPTRPGWAGWMGSQWVDALQECT